MSDDATTPSAALDPKAAFCSALPLILYALDQIAKPWAIMAASMLRRASVSICGTPDVFGDGQQGTPTVEELEDAATFVEAIKAKCGPDCCV